MSHFAYYPLIVNCSFHQVLPTAVVGFRCRGFSSYI